MKIVLIGGPLDGREEDFSSPPDKVMAVHTSQIEILRAIGRALAQPQVDASALAKTPPVRHVIYVREDPEQIRLDVVRYVFSGYHDGPLPAVEAVP